MSLSQQLRRTAAGAALALSLAIPAYAADWTDPDDTVAGDGEFLSGSAHIDGGMVDLRVTLAGPPAAATLKTYSIEWFLDLDEDTSTCDIACHVLQGADRVVQLSNSAGSPDTWVVNVITPHPNNASTITSIGCATASVDASTNTVRVTFSAAALGDATPGFNYAVLTTCGGGGCDDRSPDAAALFSTESHAADVGPAAPFSGVSMCGWPPAKPLTTPELISALADLVNSFDLVQGVEGSLDSKLDLALGALAAARTNSTTVAINQLEAFLHEVEAQRGKKLTDAQATALASLANQILAKLRG
jgi:hypothetical protein